MLLVRMAVMIMVVMLSGCRRFWALILDQFLQSFVAGKFIAAATGWFPAAVAATILVVRGIRI